MHRASLDTILTATCLELRHSCYCYFAFSSFLWVHSNNRVHFSSSSAAEFIVYKLKEMGKITEEDISLVMESFKLLDVDHSGTLTENDIALLQSSSRPKS